MLKINKMHKKIIFSLLALSLFIISYAQEFKIEFSPEPVLSSNVNIEKSDQPYKYWMYNVKIDCKNLDISDKFYTFQFQTTHYFYEKHFIYSKNDILKGLPRKIFFSDTIYVAINTYKKSENTILAQDTLIYYPQNHPKFSTELTTGSNLDKITNRFCYNYMQHKFCETTISNVALKTVDDENQNLFLEDSVIYFINRWFVGCAPCMGELPLLRELALHYKDNPNVKFVSVIELSSSSKVKKIQNKLGDSYANFRLLVDDEKLKYMNDVLGLTGYPSNYILNQNKKVMMMTNGYPLNEGMSYSDYKVGFINDEVLKNYIEMIDLLLITKD